MLKGLETSIVIGCFTSYKLSPLLPDTVSQPEGPLSAMWLSPMWWDLEWGLLDRFHPFWSFRHLSEIVIVWYIVWKYCLPVEYHVHIWQVSSQLSCGDTWQTCVGLEGSNKYFYKSKFPKTEKSMNGDLVFSTPNSLFECQVWPRLYWCDVVGNSVLFCTALWWEWNTFGIKQSQMIISGIVNQFQVEKHPYRASTHK